MNPTQCPQCQSNLPPRRLKYCSDACRSEFRNVNRRSPRAIRPPAERVLSRIEKTTTGCHEYTGYRNEHGYGVVQTGGNQTSKTMLAHRVVWADKYGEIPSGIVIRHRCDNPACVNVSHLEQGTAVDNMRDRCERGRTLQGANTARSKLSTEQVHEIRQLCAQGVTHREISSRYRISTTQVSYIRNYKSRVVA